MRAAAGRDRRQYQFSGFRLDVAARQLFGPDGAALPLTPKAIDVLAHLVEHGDRVVDKDELLATVWAGRVVEENNVTQAISALRRALGVGAGEHRFIVTVPGRGYRFVGQSTAASVAQMRRADDAAEPRVSAERFYLAGRDLVDAPSMSRCKRAIGLFRQALDADPLHARAWCGQAFAWRTLTITGDVAPAEAFPLARAAVRHALALDPDLSQAHAEHAFNLFWGDWDWAAAERECRHAIALDPQVPDGYFVCAHLLNNLGRFDEALALARRARELDPLSPLVNVLEGGFLAAAGRTHEAAARIEQALEIAPDFWIALLARAGMAHARGDIATAIGILERAARLSGRCSQVLAVLGRVLVAAGDRAGALALREELQALAKTSFVPGTSRAAISNALGFEDEALDLLELAFEQRAVRMTFLAINARWNNLRSQPRFEALMKRLGLSGVAANGFL